MNILIIYDSYFGNTKQVALDYQAELEKEFFVTVTKVTELVKANISQFDILIFGAPTRAFNISKQMRKVLMNKTFNFADKAVFVFDTRTDEGQMKKKFLKGLMNRFGYAAEKMEKILKKQNANIIMPYKYYFVEDVEGPLEAKLIEKVKADTKKLTEIIKEASS